MIKMQKIICFFLLFFLNISVVFSKPEKIGSCQSFMKDGKFDVVQLRNEELFKKSNSFASNIIDKINAGVRKGVEPCFKTGVALLDSKEIQFAHTRGWITEPFTYLMEKQPSLFRKYSEKYPMSIRSMVHVFSIDHDDLEEFRKAEILRNIKIRKTYISKYLDKDFENKINYDEILKRINEHSLRKLEVIQKNGARTVYSSEHQYLNLNKKYQLSNLIDSDKKTAWCIDYNEAKGNGVDALQPLIHAKFFLEKSGYNCRDKKYKCHIKGVEVFISSGYQKTEAVFRNNVRMKSMNVVFKNISSKEIKNKKILHFEDKQDSQKYYFPINKRLSAYSPLELWIYAGSVYKGKKYNDLCISELKFNLIK